MQEIKINDTGEMKVNVPKIVTAGLSGLAGGVYLASMFSPAVYVLFLGSLFGASVTGLAEYQREKKNHSYPQDAKHP